MGNSYRPVPPPGGSLAAVGVRSADRYFELKSEIHKKLIGILNMERVSSLPKDRIRNEIGRVVGRLLEDERVPMTTAEQNKIVEEVLDEVLGLGPLEPLLKEPTISDILVNGTCKVLNISEVAGVKDDHIQTRISSFSSGWVSPTPAKSRAGSKPQGSAHA